VTKGTEAKVEKKIENKLKHICVCVCMIDGEKGSGEGAGGCLNVFGLSRIFVYTKCLSFAFVEPLGDC
jgi:hypothetical protein